MRSWKVPIALAAISLLLAFALAAAQEPVRDFALLNTRLVPGDTIWVTDAQGREVKGRIAALGADAITLEGGDSRTFASPDVTTIKVRRNDSLGNGALIGLGVGGLGIGLACLATTAEGPDQDWCLLAAVAYGGIGAAIGVGIDAMIPGKKLVAYRAPGAAGAPSARLSIAPFVTDETAEEMAQLQDEIDAEGLWDL
ncbi:MAG: hypothetical protein R6V57_05085, partial [Vicinamibacterales bacterium]